MQHQAAGQLTSKGKKVPSRGRAASRPDLVDEAVAGQVHWIAGGCFGVWCGLETLEQTLRIN